MDRAAALRAAGMLERKERSGGEAAAGGGGGGGGGGGAGPRAGPGPGPCPAARGLPAVRSTLQQCGLLQDLIDISLSNLRGLRTKCAASNDLTQQEIRTLEVKLIDYIHRQRQCKLSVPLNDRTAELNSYPRFNDWLDIVNVRKEVVQRIPEELTLDALLEMNESKVKETMKRCGARDEECSRLNGALSCLRKVTESGGELKDDVLMNLPEARREHSATNTTESPGSSAPARTHAALNLPKGNSQQARSVSVSTITSSDSVSSSHGPSIYADNLLDPFAFPAHSGRLTPRTPHSITITPPTTPQAKRRHKLKPPRTPPPPCRKVFQLLPNFPALTRSKSHESQLGNRIDDVPPIKFELSQGSPQTVRRDFGLAVTHRFSTKSWLSQICQVCQKSMMFGVKCKYCRLKCHNKCTKEAPACRISFLPITKIRRTESVPSDINNPVDRPTEPQFGTLPKALTKKEHPPAINHLDSSSNPSSTTSSTPSSPAPFQSSNPPSATPPPNPSPMGQRDGRFNFPEIPSPAQVAQPSETAADTKAEEQPDADGVECEAEVEEPESNKSEPEDDEDEVEDLPNRRPRLQGMIYRKPSQTSVYLQEWDIPFEQIELGDPIGQGRWGKVHKGKWHGEVAIRLLEIDGNNQDHLKLFKKEVMNYRQTRHENVVLFMGACMNPPHLAIITSFCKGRTLHSFVRDPKISLDINKTRQIAQEIIKGMGYLHAKGIVHKDLKSKNVFYDNGKVVITDFGLFGISGVVQEGRRENELKLPHDWLCYLAPEIVREMAPGKDEDKLPFSKAADIYAFGTVWYELQAREWPFKNQPAEALIWQIGSGEGVKQVLATVSLGKEVNEILSACWSFDLSERPSFTVLMDMLEKLPKLNRRLSHPGHFWKSADINSSKVVLRFERFGLGILEPSNQKI
ncbi:kinase suppressor of Ras 1 isoform X2 [Anas platyrhynchos]|uniref:kinase suppressor of Ras 1 isoform X2 n=1 Tax=Anas platyrhynchos TaxID=8839 RepID=UPI000F7C4DAF|nr:kinase suppressor of Ras 1 isoform X2 [Anas platyrhynchos]|eukprot:XP_027328276.1 kinase suppressor of Ras 1 isoform X2 [Anas platyrhynchos]